MAEDGNSVHLVHHDSNVLISLFDVLCGAGFRVTASTNSLDALAFMARSKPHAALCNWEMPQMDGTEFLARLRALSPDTRVVLSSRFADGVLYEEALRLGGSDLLREPFHPLGVVHAISRMLGLDVHYLARGAAGAFSPGDRGVRPERRES